MAEWMFSQSKGRQYGAGQHEEVVRYLSDTCPAAVNGGCEEDGAGCWQAEPKLNLILAKAVQHQANLLSVSTSTADCSTGSRRRRSWQPASRARSTNTTPRTNRRSGAGQATRCSRKSEQQLSLTISDRVRHSTYDKITVTPTVQQVTDRLYHSVSRTDRSQVTASNDSELMTTSCYQLALPPTIYHQQQENAQKPTAVAEPPMAVAASATATTNAHLTTEPVAVAGHKQRLTDLTGEEVGLSDDVEDVPTSSRLPSTDRTTNNVSKATTDDGYECSASSDEADIESTSVTYNRLTKSALPQPVGQRCSGGRRQAVPDDRNASAAAVCYGGSRGHHSPAAAAAVRRPMAVAARRSGGVLSGVTSRSSVRHSRSPDSTIGSNPSTPRRREMRCSSTYDSLSGQRRVGGRSSRIACISSSASRRTYTSAKMFDKKSPVTERNTINGYVASKYSPGDQTAGLIADTTLDSPTTVTGTSPVVAEQRTSSGQFVVPQDIVIDSLRAQLSAAQSALALERHLRELQAETVEDLKRKTTQHKLETPLIDLNFFEEPAQQSSTSGYCQGGGYSSSGGNSVSSSTVATLKAEPAASALPVHSEPPSLATEVIALRRQCQQLQRQMDDLQLQVGHIVFNGRRSASEAEATAAGAATAAADDDTQIDFSSLSSYATDVNL